MTPRRFSSFDRALRSSDPDRVRLSATGRDNAARRTVWSGTYADRAFLVLSLGWLVGHWNKHLAIARRPEELYEPLTWLGALAFPEPVSSTVWLGIAAVMAAGVGVCLWRPRLVVARAVVAACALLIMATEFGHAKIEHVNHLFLLGHLYALFVPLGRPGDREQVALEAETVRWYQGGLLFVYTMAGLWKFVDMTIRAVLKPGMTWLDPAAVPGMAALSYRGLDLSLAVPEALWAVRWALPVGYVVLAFVLASAATAAFRRPLLLLVVPTVVLFHLMNALTGLAHFFSTALVAAVLLTPYDLVFPAIRRRLTPVERAPFTGNGASARYERVYTDGQADTFSGFYAYRARLEDRSWLWAAPLYYPGIALLATWMLERRTAPAAANP